MSYFNLVGSDTSCISVKMNNVSASWSGDIVVEGNKKTLQNVSFEVNEVCFVSNNTSSRQLSSP